jgi:hypothetical protein
MCNESGDGMNEDESSLRHAKAEGRHELIEQLRELQDCCGLAARRMRLNTGNSILDAERKGMAEAYFDTWKRLGAILSGSDRPDSERP